MPSDVLSQGSSRDHAPNTCAATRSALPPGERIEVVTYSLKDRAGAWRGRGLGTIEIARVLARRLTETPGNAPITIERVTHVSFTDRQPVEIVDDE